MSTEKKKSLLIADDEMHLTKLLKENLEEMGYTVNIAVDGDETLKKVIELEPDVVVLDIEMPKLNGYRVCERIMNFKEIKKKPKILMLSAYAQPEDIKRGLKLGASKYITKPFQVMELVKAIEEPSK